MSQIIHRRTFMDGRMTPRDLHNAVLFTGKKCQSCTRPPEYVLRVFAQEKEMIARDPSLLTFAALNPEKYAQMRVLTFKEGPWLRISEVLSCGHCFKDAQKAAAKGPSWTLVEIDRGPDEAKPMVGFGS